MLLIFFMTYACIKNFILLTQKFSSKLTIAFQDYLQEVCEYSVEISIRFFKCINNELAVYSVELVDEANYIVYLLMSNTMTEGIDVGIALLSPCNQSCEEPIYKSSPNHNGSNDYTKRLAVATVLSVVFLVFLLVAVLIVLILCCKHRYANDCINFDTQLYISVCVMIYILGGLLM